MPFLHTSGRKGMPVIIGDDRIDWVKHTRLLGVTIDDRLAWSHHLTDVKKSFVNKLNLLKRSSLLRREVLLDLYFKVILPAVLYGLVVWGGCVNAEQLNSLEVLHCRAICHPLKSTSIRNGAH